MFSGTKQKDERKVDYKFIDSIQLLDSKNRMHQLNCPIIGLTGGIATGKSTVSKMLSQKGLHLISADKLVKKIYQKDEVISFIKNNWPEVFSNNEINFKLLRNVAFSNIETRTKIEVEIYSHLKELFLQEYNHFKDAKLVIYDVPLLFEKKLDELIDYNVVVYSPREMQIERVIKRDNISREEAELALKNQIDIEEKKNLSNYIIENTSGLDALEQQVSNFINNVLIQAG
jgi:dephospho-CoA kinase